MTTVTDVDNLVRKLSEFGIALHKLHQFMADVDEKSAPLLVRNIKEATLEVIGRQVSCLDAAQKALSAWKTQKSLENARHFLGRCNQFFMEMFEKFYSELFTLAHLTDLERIKKKNGTRHWTHTTLDDLYTCQTALQNVCTGLLGSWKSIADDLTARSPIMNSTSIGQQNVFPQQK